MSFTQCFRISDNTIIKQYSGKKIKNHEVCNFDLAQSLIQRPLLNHLVSMLYVSFFFKKGNF